MLFIRSLLFNILFLIWTTGLGFLVIIPSLAGPRQWTQSSARFWVKGIFLLLRNIVRLYHEVHGLENIPSGPVIVAAKHQSAWDVFLFHTLFEDPIFIVKKELFAIPIVGWLIRRSGCIGIDRSRGVRALKDMLQKARDAAAGGSQIIIFPEGTRTTPGVLPTYHSGVALLYQNLSLPVIPVGLNSGIFWRKQTIVKYPGKISVEFLSPMPTGLDRHTFLVELQSRIEIASLSTSSDYLSHATRRL